MTDSAQQGHVGKVETTPEDFLLEEFIRFTCTCGKRIKAPAKYAGKVGKCPRCKKRIQIPKNKEGGYS